MRRKLKEVESRSRSGKLAWKSRSKEGSIRVGLRFSVRRFGVRKKVWVDSLGKVEKKEIEKEEGASLEEHGEKEGSFRVLTAWVEVKGKVRNETKLKNERLGEEEVRVLGVGRREADSVLNS